MLGHPCKIREISVIADHYRIPLIEDAAEAIGSNADGKPCGSWGDVSVLSFNLNKTVTAGGGGAVMTNSEALEKQARRLITTARVDHPWLIEHDAVAHNHRISMLSGALVNSQMKRLNGLLRAKRRLAEVYGNAVHGLDGVEFHTARAGTYSNYWLPTILVPLGQRDAVLTALHDRGVMARAVFTPMHRLPMYLDNTGAYPVADEIWQRAICLPSGLELAERFA
jgi:perosamine synthetase